MISSVRYDEQLDDSDAGGFGPRLFAAWRWEFSPLLHFRRECYSHRDTYRLTTFGQCLGIYVIGKAVQYVHENPVRRGLVERPEDWRWSSARAYAGIESQQWIDTDW